jgi:hypothetical protein
MTAPCEECGEHPWSMEHDPGGGDVQHTKAEWDAIPESERWSYVRTCIWCWVELNPRPVVEEE